jgi:hypothetical protein
VRTDLYLYIYITYIYTYLPFDHLNSNVGPIEMDFIAFMEASVTQTPMSLGYLIACIDEQ